MTLFLNKEKVFLVICNLWNICAGEGNLLRTKLNLRLVLKVLLLLGDHLKP